MSVWTIIVVILMLGLLVTIHELGHYWTAMLLKIKAFEVSIFVGPKLVKWKNKKGVDLGHMCSLHSWMRTATLLKAMIRSFS